MLPFEPIDPDNISKFRLLPSHQRFCY